MAKPWKVPLFSPEQSVGLGVSQLLKTRLREIYFHHAQLVEKRDAESVRACRIAARRFQVTVRFFRREIGKKNSLLLLEPIREWKGLLGQIRDLDARLALLEPRGGSLKPAQVRTARLWEARLHARREQGLERYLRFVENLDSSDFKGQVRQIADEGRESKRNEDPFIHHSERILDWLSEIGLDSSAEPDLSRADADEPEVWHRLRLQFKALRFVLEIFLPCYGEEFGEFLDEIKKLARKLGAYRDLLLLEPELTSFLREIEIYNEMVPETSFDPSDLRLWREEGRSTVAATRSELLEHLNRWRRQNPANQLRRAMII